MTNTAAPTAAEAHYFGVNVMDTRKSFWTFAEALKALEQMATENAAWLGRDMAWVGDIYAFTAEHRYISVPGNFGRAYAKIEDGKVVVVNMEGTNL